VDASTTAQRNVQNRAALVDCRENLSTDPQATRLLVIDDTRGRGQNYVAKLSRRQQVGDPVLNLGQCNIEPRGNDAALVEPPDEVDDDFAGAVVVDVLELANVSCASQRRTGQRQECASAPGRRRIASRRQRITFDAKHN
jgi:hypothetical protein